MPNMCLFRCFHHALGAVGMKQNPYDFLIVMNDHEIIASIMCCKILTFLTIYILNLNERLYGHNVLLPQSGWEPKFHDTEKIS